MSCFLVVDLLENNWASYIEDFNGLTPERQKEFLTGQGFASLRDLLAHILGWWEEGIRIIRGILDGPGFTWQSYDVDAVNAALIQKYSTWSDDDLFKHYEALRIALLELVANLPEEAFLNKDIETWLVEDVIEHYDEHSILV